MMSRAKNIIDLMRMMHASSGETYFALRDGVVAGIEDLEAELATAQTDAHDRIADLNTELASLVENYEREKAIVTRVWEQLGNPSYESLNGRSIYDLIDELKAERDAAVASLRQIADPNAFLHSGDDASLARRYEEIAQAALDMFKQANQTLLNLTL
jgi:hypothetical protein